MRVKLTTILCLLTFMAFGAVPPPITRSILTTNIPPAGAAGQLLTRVSASPYLGWTDDYILRTNGTVYGNLVFATTLTMPNSGSAGIYWLNNTNLVLSNGLAWVCLNTNGVIGIGKKPLFSAYKMEMDGTFRLGSVILDNAGLIGFNGRGFIQSPQDAVYTFVNNAGTDFSRLILGTNSAAATNFPALAKVGTGPQAVPGLAVVAADWSTPAKFGVGTNAPAAALHVASGNTQDYVIQAGTTNKPSQLTLNTNGVLSVNPGGGLNQVGCYGSLMMNATNIVVCAGAASVYTNVAGTGFTTIVTNGFYGDITGNSSALTNLYAGFYRITVCASALGQNNQATEWEVFTNNVACDLVGMKKTYDAAARMDDLSMTGILYLPASCRTDFRVQDAGTGGSIAIHRASLTIGTP